MKSGEATYRDQFMPVAFKSLAAIFATALISWTTVAHAFPEEKEYTTIGKWRIMAVSEGNRFHFCAADTDNNAVTLRIATDGRSWQLGNPYYDNGPVSGQWGFDGWEDSALFRTDGDGWAVMDVDRHILESLRAMDSFSLELDRGPQTWRLKGASIALKKVLECARNKGRIETASAGRRSDFGWVPGRAGEPVDSRAVAAGAMPDGLEAFVCAGRLKGGTHPGMTGVWIEGCSVGYGGRAVTVRDYDLLVGAGRWVPVSGDRFPANAVQGGSEADGRPLFVCRARHEGGTFAGKTRPGFNGCNIPDLGREITIYSFDILTQ